MKSCFLALSNKAGIACAADADHSIFRLAKDIPVALAVNSASSIPWEQIINSYQQKGPIVRHKTLAEYVADFGAFLSSFPVREGWTDSPKEDLSLFFLGFGALDIFPSVISVCAQITKGVLGLEELYRKSIGKDGDVFCHHFGDFENVATLIWGVTERTRSFFITEDMEMFQVYADRVRDRFKGTIYESYVNTHLDRYESEAAIMSIVDEATCHVLQSFELGVGSFSVEDMVTAVESLVKANAKLSHLRSGAKGEPADVKEIAVITIPEGVSWIKHSLFKRRTEI